MKKLSIIVVVTALGAIPALAQIAIAPSGDVTLGTANRQPQSNVTVNGELNVNGTAVSTDKVVSVFMKGVATNTVSCPIGHIVSGGGFYLLPDGTGKGYAQGLCGWGAVSCPFGATSCSITPTKTQTGGCGSEDDADAISMVQIACE